MKSPRVDIEQLHDDWLGMAQPEGLVVTAAALKDAQAAITWPVGELQAALSDLAGERHDYLADVRALGHAVLGWSDEFIVEGAALPAKLRVPMDGAESLVPTLALRSADDPDTFVFLVEKVRKGLGLDTATEDRHWTATPHQRFERLVRETGVHVGLLTNGSVFRLVYAPRGESVGWIDFRLADLLNVDGRALLGAFHMLLCESRLLTLETRLIHLFQRSREYQNTVSIRLRDQVLDSLRELLRGFQQADQLAGGRILSEYRREAPQEIYKGLVTVLMRMVFVLYAEERGLLPMGHDLYASSYSLTRLYAQLADDEARYGNTIDDRYGAWARIIALFRALHDGLRVPHAPGGPLQIPNRKGDFFNPDAFPYLEGRARGDVRQTTGAAPLDLPRISDGIVYRALDQLLLLDGQRLQYSGLDVEQIGSVYEGLMGFEIELTEGRSITLANNAVLDLDALVQLDTGKRVEAVKNRTGVDLTDRIERDLKAASSVDDVQKALAKKTSTRQPGLILPGTLYLQPGEERRKTGSHYTPRSLTQPIVETTLRPLLDRLGADATATQILELKVCDPAMGSGAFLVETCRQLADRIVEAWRHHGTLPEIPPDEDPVLHARRLVAQQCIYGVDKNPLAVDLARLSLWLVTFAKEHPFTFVDHALRCGDSLVGLSREQIASLSLDTAKGTTVPTVRAVVEPAVRRAEELRKRIHAIGDPPDTAQLKELWRETNEALETVRLLGDLVVAAFFAGTSAKARQRELAALATRAQAWLSTGDGDAGLRSLVDELHSGPDSLSPFHWEIEFPEVFAQGGFDVFVGNPPFLGGSKISTMLGDHYLAWVLSLHPDSHGNGDFVAHFFRRAFNLLRHGGTFGLIATNTIAQGDTRTTGLRWICTHGGTIFGAQRRYKWPGVAAVIVSLVYIVKGAGPIRCFLDGKPVEKISAFLFPGGSHESPSTLSERAGSAFLGSKIYGQGFLFDDADRGANPIVEMRRLIEKDPRNAERIFPYLGGEELNTSPTQSHHRFVINFGQVSEIEARQWPDLMAIVEQRVKPERDRLREDTGPGAHGKKWWWQFQHTRHELYTAIHGMDRVLADSQVSAHLAFAFQPAGRIFAHTLNVFAISEFGAFALLQSRPHEVWARFFGSSMKDDLRYTPSDCFETFPFPRGWQGDATLEEAGRTYYDFRAALMVRNNQGLTATYNRFHDPNEADSEIARLRVLHAAMDRAVLDAYGWTDVLPVCDFRQQLDERVRLTWSDDVRDEVLARLLELNRRIAAEEAQPVTASAPTTKGRKPKKSKVASASATLALALGDTPPRSDSDG